MREAALRPIAIAILATSLVCPAAAQRPPADANPPPAASTLPVSAMRHVQPRRAEVDERERARLGPQAARQQKQQRATVDQLYQEIMRRSAPVEGR